MNDRTVFDVIQQALTVLEKDVGLAESSLNTVSSRSFKPISDFFMEKQQASYSDAILDELEDVYRGRYEAGAISRDTYNLRTRGIRIVREVYQTGGFVWKGHACNEVPALPESLEHIASGFAETVSALARGHNILTIVRRFLLLLYSLGIDNVAEAKPEHLQLFLKDISKTRSKSMDDVIDALRKLDRYLAGPGQPGLPYAGLLMAPRAREGKIHPHMPEGDLDSAIRSIDLETAIGKRDFAILLLAAGSGMRAGDIARIKLTDIDWRAREIHIIQGKTRAPLSLPLQKGVAAALADYILNGRPESKSPEVFLRCVAPFQALKDGVSIACVLRGRLKAAGVAHAPGDGRTMHGIRRMLATQMTAKGVPVTTTSQVLGQQDPGSSRPYISLDIEGLRECALGFACLKGGL